MKGYKVFFFPVAVVALAGGIVLLAWGLHRLLDDRSRGAGLALAAVIAALPVLAGGALAWPRVLGIPRWPGWRPAAAALPDFSLASSFLLAWAASDLVGRETSKFLATTMGIELIVILAWPLLLVLPDKGSLAARAAMFWGFAAFLGMFAAFLSWGATGSGWPFVGFAVLLANKFLDDLLSPPEDSFPRWIRHMKRWGMSAALYTLAVVGTSMLPIPDLGADFRLGSAGAWADRPALLLSAGAMYFTGLGIFELYGSPPPAAREARRPAP